MAYQGRKVFAAGEVLTASDLNSTVDQTIMVFADASARDTAIPTPVEGMVCYLKSDNSVLKYDGSAWVSVALDINLDADRAVITNAGGDLVVSAVTASELEFLDGVTSNVQTQLDGKQDDIITTQGDLIIGDGSGDAVRLPVGAADTVLTSDGTTLSFAVASGGGGELYADGSHTVSEVGGVYLVDFNKGGSADGIPLTQGINILSGFTNLKVFPTTTPWVTRISGFGNDTIRGLVYGDSLWVAAGANAKLATSPDGITWTQRTSSFGLSFISSIAYDNGLYVAVAFDAKIATSPDGINWTQRTNPFGTNSIIDVAYGNGIWIAVGNNGTLATSPDGINWTLRGQTFGSSILRGIVYGDNLWVKVGGTNQGATSPDGITWTIRDIQLSGYGVNKVTFGGGLFVAVANFGSVSTSPDGITWTQRNRVSTPNLQNASFGNNSYFACGNSGHLISSETGTAYVSAIDNFGSSSIENVRFGDGLWVIVGANGKLSTLSPAGVLLLTELPAPILP